MRLDPRITIPAALAAAALALPATGAADPPSSHVFCPNSGDPNSKWVLTSTIIAPSAASKDRNGDTLVCQKTDGNATKDNNNPPPPSPNPDDYVDNLLDG